MARVLRNAWTVWKRSAGFLGDLFFQGLLSVLYVILVPPFALVLSLTVRRGESDSSSYWILSGERDGSLRAAKRGY